MNATRLAVLALVASILTLAATLLKSDGTARAGGVDAPSTDTGDLERLEQRIAALETSIEMLRTRPRAPPIATRQPAAESEAAGEELQARLSELEQWVEGQEQQEDVLTAREIMSRSGRRGDDAESVQENTDKALDPNSTPEEMLDTLRGLRGVRLEDGTDARLAVLPEMIALAQRSQEGEVRSDIWRQLSGVEDPSLLTPLLDALANDPYARAREEAAETLADFMPDPTVESALRYSMEQDQDADVRKQAGRALKGGR